MAKAFGNNQSEWPSPMNIASVLSYVATLIEKATKNHPIEPFAENPIAQNGEVQPSIQ